MISRSNKGGALSDMFLVDGAEDPRGDKGGLITVSVILYSFDGLIKSK